MSPLSLWMYWWKWMLHGKSFPSPWENGKENLAIKDFAKRNVALSATTKVLTGTSIYTATKAAYANIYTKFDTLKLNIVEKS